MVAYLCPEMPGAPAGRFKGWKLESSEGWFIHMSDGWLGPLPELLAGTPLCGLGFLTMWWLSPKESGERERDREGTQRKSYCLL